MRPVDRALDAVAASRSHRTITAECVAAVVTALADRDPNRPSNLTDVLLKAAVEQMTGGRRMTFAEAVAYAEGVRDALEVADG